MTGKGRFGATQFLQGTALWGSLESPELGVGDWLAVKAPHPHRRMLSLFSPTDVSPRECFQHRVPPLLGPRVL